MVAGNKTKIVFSLHLAVILVGLTQVVYADVIPKWSEMSPIEIIIDDGDSTTYQATGSVELGTLDAILIYDVSGSMSNDTGLVAPNGGMQRGDWGEAGAMAFVDSLPDIARLGLTQFAATSSEVVPLTPVGGVGSAQRELLNMTIDGMPRSGGSTNIQNAIEFATSLLDDSVVNSDSKHLVLLTDGRQTSGNAVAAAEMALVLGIDTVNTVGLPGADTTLLSEVADAGNGVFVDGTDLSMLIEDFENILSDVETLDKLEILKDGELIGEFGTDAEDGFSVLLDVALGDNVFTARATSNLGNVRESELLIRGISAVPEPASCSILFGFASLLMVRRQRQL